MLALTDFYTPRGQTTEDYAAIPALAVPTVEKSVFECPEEHVDLLKRLLPQVDRVLIIGWRAQERTFVEIVGDLVNADSLRGSVISGSRKGAEETVLRLQEIWAGADLTPFPKGFTEFVLTDESLLSLLED